MKFLPKEPESHPYGTVSSESWFAWLPVTIDGETRWLERVTVEYVWGMGNFYMGQGDGWQLNKFL